MLQLLWLRLNFFWKGSGSMLWFIGSCSLLSSLPLPPFLSVSDGEESPLALAITPQRLATELSFARVNRDGARERG